MTGTRRFIYRDGIASRIVQTSSRDATEFAFLINRITGRKIFAVRLASGEPRTIRGSREQR